METKSTALRRNRGRPTGFATRWFGLCLLGLLLCSAGSASGQTAAEAWVRRASFGEFTSEERAVQVRADAEGNVIVTGTTDDGTTELDILTIKYSGAGMPLWTNRYDGPGRGNDTVTALALDSSGNVFVTGQSTDGDGNLDYVTIAYSAAGVALWTNFYSGPGNAQDYPRAIAVDNSGNVFVTGYSYLGGLDIDYATVAYSKAGVALWTNRYDGSGNLYDQALAVAVDGNGHVFVTGESGGSGGDSDYATIAYSRAGVALWTNRCSGPGTSGKGAIDLAVDNSGRVFVTGVSGDDFVTIAYSATGAAFWTNYYDGPFHGTDQANALAVDSSGNVFVAGAAVGPEGNWDYVTIAYSGAGVALWTNSYTGPGHYEDYPCAVAVDNTGNVYVTGYWSENTGKAYYTTIAYSGAGSALWTNYYKGPGEEGDFAAALAVDSSGTVFVTGNSVDSSGYHFDFATLAYSGTGQALWTNRYNGAGNVPDFARALAVGNSGKVYVTGASTDTAGLLDYVTVAYSSAGVALWTNRYDAGEFSLDQPRSIAVDNSGKVFVTGASSGNGFRSDYATIAYSEAGVALWTNRYDGPGSGTDQANALAVDNSGKVYVTGYSTDINGNLDYTTIAYLGSGVALWTNRFDGPSNATDVATALAVDSSGNVLVTGYSAIGGATGVAYATISYSSAGVALWTNLYRGPGEFGDMATAVAVDSRGNVFVTGASFGIQSASDYATIAYSKAGVPLWTNRYDGPANNEDRANAIAVDVRGNVYVTGFSGTTINHDYATIAYSGSGAALWTNRYEGPGNGEDLAFAVAVDHGGNVVVTGFSLGGSGNYDYATIAYSSAGIPLWTNRYNGPANGDDFTGIQCLAIGPDGAVYVTGYSDGHYGSADVPDFATVKYVRRPQLSIQPSMAGASVVDLKLSGALNSSWSIERTLRISGPWTRLGSSLIGPNGFGTFQDMNPPAQGALYRAVQP